MLKLAKHNSRLVSAIAFAVSVATISGCDSKSADQYVQSAQTHRSNGEISAAIIDLKNALQKDPKNQAARLLLARLFLDRSDPAGAEAEIQRAREEGADKVSTAKPLAEAELLLGKPDAALKEADPSFGTTPEQKAGLFAMRGLALMELGQAEDARQALEAGLKEDPHSVDVLSAMARQALGAHDLQTARDRLAEAQKEDPKNPSLFSLQGAIAFATGDYAASEQAYQNMLDAAKWNFSARLGLARAQIARSKLKDAETTLGVVLKAAPNEPNANYLAALAAYQEGNYADAQTRIQRTLAVSKNFPPAILLAGAANYGMKQYEIANTYLSQYVYLVPQNVQARKLLASVQIMLGHSSDAVKTLSPAVSETSNDVQLLGIIGVASAQNGDLTAASRYLSEAVAQQPDNASLRTQLGVTKVALGDTEAGIDELEQAAQQDPEALRPEVALFAAYLRNKQYDKALEIAERLQKKYPDKPIGFDFAGAAYLGKDQRDAANTALLKARELHPGDPFACRALANLALQAGNVDATIQYTQEILKANPKDMQAYIDLAALQANQGHVDQMQATLGDAIKQDPDNISPRLALARFFLLTGKYREALDSVNPALVKNPNSAPLLEVVGRAQMGLKNVDAATSAFRTLVEAKPDAGASHRYLAEAYAATGEMDQAFAEASKAVELDPKDSLAKIMLTRMDMAKQDYAGADKLTHELAEDLPKDANVAQLQGDVAMAQGHVQDAIAAFQRGISLTDNAFFRTRLAEAQMQAGQPAEAEKTLLPWIEAHPDDAAARLTLGDIYLAANRGADAKAQYTAILQKNPNDAIAENNLAWVLFQEGQTDDALKHAHRAAELAPDSSQVLDTLGVVLLKNRKSNEALDALKKAANATPNPGPDVRFHLAQALVATGAKDDARESLRALLGTGEQFKERAQAQKLLDDLGS
jgi:putative PEP-CTERM system TPR-repeat lipoprotein